MTETIQPLQDRVLVRRISEEATSKGGIIIPDSAKERPARGIIVAVGPGLSKTLLIEQMRVGDKIMFSKYAGHEIKIDDEDHLILKEDEILGIITEVK